MTDSGITRARTAEEFLDRTAAAARRRIVTATQRYADEVCDATGLRRGIRRHPFGALALGVTVGLVGGPKFVRRLRTSRLSRLALTSLTRLATRH